MSCCSQVLLFCVGIVDINDRIRMVLYSIFCLKVNECFFIWCKLNFFVNLYSRKYSSRFHKINTERSSMTALFYLRWKAKKLAFIWLVKPFWECCWDSLKLHHVQVSYAQRPEKDFHLALLSQAISWRFCLAVFIGKMKEHLSFDASCEEK